MDRRDGSEMAIEQVEQEIDALLIRALPQDTAIGLLSSVSHEWLKIFNQAAEGKLDG